MKKPSAILSYPKEPHIVVHSTLCVKSRYNEAGDVIKQDTEINSTIRLSAVPDITKMIEELRGKGMRLGTNISKPLNCVILTPERSKKLKSGIVVNSRELPPVSCPVFIYDFVVGSNYVAFRWPVLLYKGGTISQEECMNTVIRQKAEMEQIESSYPPLRTDRGHPFFELALFEDKPA